MISNIIGIRFENDEPVGSLVLWCCYAIINVTYLTRKRMAGNDKTVAN